MAKETRFERNGILTDAEQALLASKRVLVVGCGGLGGYSIEQLARLGVKHLTVIDGDVFAESNLNRQLLATVDNLGKYKAIMAKERVHLIDPTIKMAGVIKYLTADNAIALVQGHDIVLDAVDNNGTRRILQNACETLGIPMIYGAIAGWYGQVTTIFPGDKTLDRLLGTSPDKGVETKIGNPAFTPAIVASYQVAEALKVLLSKGEILRDQMMCIDLLYNDVTYVDILSDDFGEQTDFSVKSS